MQSNESMQYALTRYLAQPASVKRIGNDHSCMFTGLSSYPLGQIF